MADRYEPRLAVRPRREQNTAPPPPAGASPIATVVLVSRTSDPGPTVRSETVTVNRSVAADGALSNDLESELVNNPPASPASIRQVPSPAPLDRPRPVPSETVAAPAPKPIAATQLPMRESAAPAAARPGTPTGAPAARPERPIVKPERRALEVRAHKAAQPAAPRLPERRVPAPDVTDRPALARATAAASETAENPVLAKSRLRSTTAAHLGPTEAAARRSARRERRQEESPVTAAKPSPFAPTPRGAELFPQRIAPPQPKPTEDKLPKVASFGGGEPIDEACNDEPLPLENVDTLALDSDDDGELPSFFRRREEQFSHRPPRRSLFIGGILAAVAMAVGLGHILTRNEGSVAPAQGADKISLVRPSDREVVAAAASGDENKPISRLIASGGPGFDSPITIGEVPASADRLATNDASGGDESGQILSKKAQPLVLNPDMPAVGSKAADNADKLPRSVNPTAAPSIMPAAESARAGASSDAAIGETQADTAVDSRKVSPIPVNADPPAVGGGDKPVTDASVGAASAPGGSPRPGSIPSSDAGAAVPASDDSAAATDDAAGAPAAPAEPPTPPAKPVNKPIIFPSRRGPIGIAPNKAGKPLASSRAGHSSDVFVQLSAQKSQGAAKSTYYGLQTKFPTILGNLDPTIQRADLGDKGVVYRVRIGPFALADAQKFCGSYNAVGGSDCLIVRH